MTKKILVVDDEGNILKLYGRELRDEGYEVMTAYNARDGLRIFKEERPDLVILDIRLPGMDGLEAMSHMLHMDRTVPVVLNSAYSCYKDSFLCWAADAYVDKSSDLHELKRTVRELLTSYADRIESRRTKEAAGGFV